MCGILLEQGFVGSWSLRVAIVSRTWYRTWWGRCLAPDPFFYVYDVALCVIEAAQRVGEPCCIQENVGRRDGRLEKLMRCVAKKI